MELCLAHPVKDSNLYASDQDSLCPLVCLCFLSVTRTSIVATFLSFSPDELHLLSANKQTNNRTTSKHTGPPANSTHRGTEEARVSVVETSALTPPYLGLPTSKLDWSLRSPATFWYCWFLSPEWDRSPLKNAFGKRRPYRKSTTSCVQR